MTANQVITESIREEISESIRLAELNTSGEIRVHFEDECSSDPVERAWYIFEKLKMHETKDRNGVLFYVAVSDRKFAIIGDEGIHQKVGSDFWNSTKNHVITHLSQGDYSLALCNGVKEAGEQLKRYFPYHKEDKNELSNDVSIGEQQ